MEGVDSLPVYFRLSSFRRTKKDSEGLKWGTLRAGMHMVVCCWIFCAFFATLFFKEKVPNPRRNTILSLPSASFTHFMFTLFLSFRDKGKFPPPRSSLFLRYVPARYRPYRLNKRHCFFSKSRISESNFSSLLGTGGGKGVSSFLRLRLESRRMNKKMAKAMITKSSMVCMKFP